MVMRMLTCWAAETTWLQEVDQSDYEKAHETAT